ncbi:D-glycero-beta-D-manno-heptose-7-phosphate kinase [Leptospira perolatii]|uniref:D-glycero-beta-D-manno-heptose-7-phosphate kinase n=1 Tax=Leptospira perolatii TaxID=2023191 RepID=A0A2M9ZJ46_9LEPT|nr:D-glycero-beta-D-manno-heptose-7-phosphate kinase [Leptospira perolatii]PJZ69526.1 D-glycero-beta-D-manno-heptose-7-phosphate kinase [Leptospira perolatii]PJZ72041.1 D-glycero-beta-D-manno-heptose-7-phosphate kinase [Leptospira perolatii]
MYTIEPHTYAKAISRLPELKVIVIGDLILDEYLIGEVNRISPEAPVPVVWVRSENSTLGGAGNVIKNLSKFGVKSVVLGRCGEDETSKLLLRLLEQENTSAKDNKIVKSTHVPTILKTRVIAGHQQVCRIDREETFPLTASEENELLQAFEERIAQADAVILSDYDKGTLTPKLIQGVIDLSIKQGKIVTVDPQVSHFFQYNGASIMTPNHHEAGKALGRKLESDADVEFAAKEIAAQLDSPMMMITRGEKGLSLYSKQFDKTTHIPTVAQAVFDVTGAGDTVISTFTAFLAAGFNEIQAAVISNVAAGIVVGKLGAETTSIEELTDALNLKGILI